MSPELYFAFTLIVKMVMTAGFLLAATMVAERAGPLIGGLVATLPISAGPVYIFLALDHDRYFIAESALGSLVTNGVNAAFAVTYVLVAQRHSLTLSLAGAFTTWAVLSYAVGLVSWTLPLGIIFNVVVIGASLVIVHPFRHVRVPPPPTRWYDLVIRAGMVALLVGVVVTLSFTIGATASGSLAVFPIVLSSIMILLHRRIGGKATAAIMANAVVGLGGFAVAVASLNVMAVPLGSPLALTLALAVSAGCNLLIYLARRRGLM